MIEEPTCTNCSQPLGPSSLYCERCIRRDNELWYVWRDRLATVRSAAFEADYIAAETARLRVTT